MNFYKLKWYLKLKVQNFEKNKIAKLAFFFKKYILKSCTDGV